MHVVHTIQLAQPYKIVDGCLKSRFVEIECMTLNMKFILEALLSRFILPLKRPVGYLYAIKSYIKLDRGASSSYLGCIS